MKSTIPCRVEVYTHYYRCHDGRRLEYIRTEESEKGMLNRQIRSMQTEGHFGDIKENDNVRRFNYRSSHKVYQEYMKNTLQESRCFSKPDSCQGIFRFTF